MSYTAPVSSSDVSDGDWTYAPQTVFGSWLIAEMSPWVLAQPSPALAWYLDSFGAMFDAVVNLVYDKGVDGQGGGYVPGYGTLLDPNACSAPNLPYLGQYVGVDIPAGTPDGAARGLVEAEAGFRRGTPAAVLQAAKNNLIGTQTCSLIERTYADGITATAGWFLLFARPEECPSPAALTAAVNAVRPAGVFWTLALVDGFTWISAIHTWTADAMTWDQSAYIQP